MQDRGTYPRRSTLGTIIEIRCEQNINTLIAAFEASPTGTIRIGGRAYNATLGVSVINWGNIPKQSQSIH